MSKDDAFSSVKVLRFGISTLRIWGWGPHIYSGSVNLLNMLRTTHPSSIPFILAGGLGSLDYGSYRDLPDNRESAGKEHEAWSENRV